MPPPALAQATGRPNGGPVTRALGHGGWNSRARRRRGSSSSTPSRRTGSLLAPWPPRTTHSHGPHGQLAEDCREPSRACASEVCDSGAPLQGKPQGTLTKVPTDRVPGKFPKGVGRVRWASGVVGRALGQFQALAKAPHKMRNKVNNNWGIDTVQLLSQYFCGTLGRSWDSPMALPTNILEARRTPPTPCGSFAGNFFGTPCRDLFLPTSSHLSQDFPGTGPVRGRQRRKVKCATPSVRPDVCGPSTVLAPRAATLGTGGESEAHGGEVGAGWAGAESRC